MRSSLLLSLSLTLLACLETRDAKPGEADSSEELAADTEGETAVTPDTAPDTSVLADTSPTPDAEPDVGLSEGAIVASEGDEVPPLTLVHLRVEPPAELGPIVSWRWTVVQPPGSVSTFTPSSHVAEPSFEANIVGTYHFSVVVTGQSGAQRTLTYILYVFSGAGFYVELSWQTPGDSNEADTGGDQYYFSAGSDLHLHLAHPKAYGDWFHYAWDCYWENTQPEWGIFAPEDNPRLDRDDTDGAGPEVISLRRPEPDMTYRVGIHYWDDWGYGQSYATVRIFHDGALVDEWGQVELINDDMWESHLIHSDGRVERIGDTPLIIRNFREL